MEQYAGQGFGVIAAHPVDRGDRLEAAEVLRATRRLGVKEPVYLDANLVVQRGLQARVYPTFALVDRKGQVRYRHAGALNYRGERALVKEIDRLLAER